MIKADQSTAFGQWFIVTWPVNPHAPLSAETGYLVTAPRAGCGSRLECADEFPANTDIDDPPTTLIIRLRCTALVLPLLLVSLINSLTVHAAAASTRDDALFRTEVLVASQAPGELNRALPLALTQVLTRLTANPAVNNDRWAQVAASKARTYLSQYQYEQRPSADPENPAELTYLL